MWAWVSILSMRRSSSARSPWQVRCAAACIDSRDARRWPLFTSSRASVSTLSVMRSHASASATAVVGSAHFRCARCVENLGERALGAAQTFDVAAPCRGAGLRRWRRDSHRPVRETPARVARGQRVRVVEHGFERHAGADEAVRIGENAFAERKQCAIVTRLSAQALERCRARSCARCAQPSAPSRVPRASPRKSAMRCARYASIIVGQRIAGRGGFPRSATPDSRSTRARCRCAVATPRAIIVSPGAMPSNDSRITTRPVSSIDADAVVHGGQQPESDAEHGQQRERMPIRRRRRSARARWSARVRASCRSTRSRPKLKVPAKSGFSTIAVVIGIQ